MKAMRTVLEMTDDQLNQVAPMLERLGDGNSIIAQVYSDGIRCKLLTPEQTDSVRKALGTTCEEWESSAFVVEEKVQIMERAKATGANHG